MDSSTEPNGQLIKVGTGFALLYSEEIRQDQAHRLSLYWQDKFPGVPLVVIPECRYVATDDTAFFEFRGEAMTQGVADAFRGWWDREKRGEEPPIQWIRNDE